uniref:Exostosin domain-containing protein n=1 Tax=Trichuris muris TaxID=70415 RepID=A0A5S6QDT6_TRIMR
MSISFSVSRLGVIDSCPSSRHAQYVDKKKAFSTVRINEEVLRRLRERRSVPYQIGGEAYDLPVELTSNSVVHEREAVQFGPKLYASDSDRLAVGRQSFQDVNHKLDDLLDRTEKQLKEASNSLHKTVFAHTSAPVCVNSGDELLKCYGQNPKRSLKCRETAQKFLECMAQNGVNVFHFRFAVGFIWHVIGPVLRIPLFITVRLIWTFFSCALAGMELVLWSHRTRVFAIISMTMAWFAVEFLFIVAEPFRSRKRVSVPINPVLPLNDSQDDTPFQLDCRWWSCFNPYKCLIHPSGRLTLHLLSFGDDAALGGGPARSISSDFATVVTKSAHFVSTSDDACLAVGFLSSHADREMELKRLKSTLRWNGGENSLIFDLLNDNTSAQRSKLVLRTGKAALASCQIRWYLYRPFFDVKTPCLSMESLESTSDLIVHRNACRLWTLTSAQLVYPMHIKYVLNRLASKHSSNFSLWLPCKHATEGHEICDQQGYPSRYVDVLLKSDFCLVLDDSGNAMVMLSRSLQHGCIPVIVGDRIVLPFEEKIDWTKCSLQIPLYKLFKVMGILKTVSETKKMLLRSQGFMIWQKYFSSFKTIVETALHIFEQRIPFAKAVGSEF